MDISNNSSSVARSCWKKYYWRYKQRLTPIKQSSALSLGKAVHNAFDFYYKGAPIKETVNDLAKSFDDEIAQSSPEESESLVLSKYTALGMFTQCPFLGAKFDKIESEKSFRVPLYRGVTFIGRIDGLVNKNGDWWVRELKTTGQTLRQFNQRISSSAQGTAYVWAAKQLGYDVKGIMYDFIKKPLLRKRVSEDQNQFGTRIMADYKARPDFYFGQIYSYRSDMEIEIWKNDAISLAKEIRGKGRTKRYYRNTANCYNYNSECPYKKICFEEKPDNLMLQLYFKYKGQPIK